MLGSQIRVLVVDDSAFMRKMISDMLNRNQEIKVIGTARNGQEAIIKRKQLQPDVITLDIEMPKMNGLETLKYIMDSDPCPIIMISSTTKEGAENTLLAMEYGAVDFVAKPSGAISLDIAKVEHIVVEKVRSAAKAKLFRSKSIQQDEQKSSNNLLQPTRIGLKRKVIAIGASTGGPRALKDVLMNLPKNVSAPIVIVQHMPAGFTQSFAERLNALSSISVKEAQDGDVLQNGTAYIAPGGYHIKIKKADHRLVIETCLDEPQKGHRPSVDYMFESLASIDTLSTLAVILTGMGADGSEGLKKLKQSECYAIAEAEESCVVFGMPKAAIKTNLVDEVVHIQKMAERIIRNI